MTTCHHSIRQHLLLLLIVKLKVLLLILNLVLSHWRLVLRDTSSYNILGVLLSSLTYIIDRGGDLWLECAIRINCILLAHLLLFLI